MLDGSQSNLANLLFDLGAVQFGEFRLKLHEMQPDAPLSPIYFNLRTPDNPKPGPMTESVLEMIGAGLAQVILERGLRFDHFAGIPNAGEPLAQSLSNQMEISGQRIYLSKTTLPDGQRRIANVDAGSYSIGDTVLLIDDLVSGADTKLEAIKSLEASGLKVRDLLVLIDREQGGRLLLQEAGYRVHSVFKIGQLLSHYVEIGRITPETADTVIGYAVQQRMIQGPGH